MTNVNIPPLTKEKNMKEQLHKDAAKTLIFGQFLTNMVVFRQTAVMRNFEFSMRTSLYILLIIILGSCEKIKFKDIETVVERDIFRFDNTESEKINGTISEFLKIKTLIIDSGEYLQELILLQNQFENESTVLIQKFGEFWYSRYKQIIELELKSSNYRLSKNDNFREEFMVDFIMSIIEKNPMKKIIINCGMFHLICPTRQRNMI